MKTVIALSTLLITLALAPAAEAVSIRDIVELSRAGLSDDVIVAVIDTDGTIFSLDAAQIVQLKQAGVSERVVLAMLRSGRQTAEPTATAAQIPATPTESAPSPIVVEAQPAPPVVMVVPTPVFVPIAAPRNFTVPPFQQIHSTATPFTGFGRFINTGFITPNTVISIPVINLPVRR
jgi:hypothetical protein